MKRLPDVYQQFSPLENSLNGVMRELDAQLFDRGLSHVTNYEQRMALYSHWCHDFSHSSLLQKKLARKRQHQAFDACDQDNRSYHDLANLYYALLEGGNTLGSLSNGDGYLQAVRGIKTESPEVLLLGFSTVYSLENLAAIMHLVGFSEGSITAFDKAPQPLHEAQQYCNGRLYSLAIRYKQGDARWLTFPSDTFNLVATHFFFTQIPDTEKVDVMR